MPLGVWFQPHLALRPGLIDTHNVDEVILVCGAVALHRSAG